MTLLVYWSLAEVAAEHAGVVYGVMAELALQKAAQMMYFWRERRHICENYSPYSPESAVAPGNNQTNHECTGWQFYNWGALGGVPALLGSG